MIASSKELPKFTADICIIGAGAAGISLAKELSNSNKSVILLESGGQDYSEKAQALNKGLSTNPDRLPLDSTRLRFFGGTTNHWTGLVQEFREKDFDKWPISKNELNKHYDRAKKLVHFKQTKHKPTPFVFNKNLLQTSYLYYTGPVKFGEEYEKYLAPIPVVLNANVNSLKTNEAKNRIIGIECTDLEGNKLDYQAKTYVVATGAIENATLLLRSGLALKNDEIGRNLMDHPISHCAEIIQTGAVSLESFLCDTETHRPVLSLGSPKQTDASCYIWKESSGLSIGGRELAKIVKEERLPSSTQVEKIARDLDKVLLERFTKPKANLEVVAALEQQASSKNKITLSSEKDYLGNCLPKVDWSVDDLEQEAMKNLLINIGRELGRLGLGRLRIKNSPTFSDYNHPAGTTMMGRVTDKNCRVKGISNLYIAGSSLFCSTSIYNPTLTILALTLRLADYLKSRPIVS